VISDGLAELPPGAVIVSDGLAAILPGSRLYGPGLAVVGPDCWPLSALCDCAIDIPTDDSWAGLPALLGDTFYRVELAPWYSTRVPESGEFAGLLVTNVSGFDSTPVERDIMPLAGSGGVAGQSRDVPRVLRFEGLLIACTNAGLTYGLRWLSYQLRGAATGDDSVLRYLNAHPGGSAADPAALLRELRGVVLTKAPEVVEAITTGQHPQATAYRITWELTATCPWPYLPAQQVTVDWDQIVFQPINWVHADDCALPESCNTMPKLFSADCIPEEISVVTTPPPVCGGCLPVDGLLSHRFRVPTFDRPILSRETAVTISIRNTGNRALSMQAFWRPCGTDIRCDINRFPVQVSGLPAGAELVLDGVTGRYWANHDGRRKTPVGVVGTPSGAPWRPPVIDRADCWDFLLQTAPDAEFAVSMVLSDREP
jgi:hypothetical protein